MAADRHTCARHPRTPRRGFVLFELLVAMGVIGILATLLLGVVMRARHHARDARCKGNLNHLWKAVSFYANDHRDFLFVNHFPALRISNVMWKEQRPTGYGLLFPNYLGDKHSYYCPDDPARDPEWQEFGWDAHWGTPEGEVQCSYGWRGRQSFVSDPAVGLSLATIDTHRQKLIGCDYNESFTAPVRIHHDDHMNVLRCNGSVEQVGLTPSFGPADTDFVDAINALDK